MSEYYDLDGDGDADAVGYDSNNDGGIDTVAVDSNSDGQLTAQDSLSAGYSVSVTLTGQVDGPGCR